MAEWERREEQLVLHRVTYVIPSGAGWDVVQKALSQATAEWRELSGLDKNAEVPASEVTWHGTEEGVVVRFEAIDAGTDSREAFERRMDDMVGALLAHSAEEPAGEAEPEPVGDQPVEAPDTEEGEGRG